jgi:hypothetical protein
MKPASENLATRVLAARDQLGHIGNLVEAFRMASADTGDRAVVNALQAIASTVQERIDALGEALSDLQSEVSNG